MNKGIIRLAFTLATVGAAGCANLNSVYRTFDVEKSESVMVDVKQRAVFVAKRTTTQYDSSGKAISSQDWPVVCAEPSPDAMSAYAAEFAAHADTPAKVSAGLSLATQENASFVGLRTTSIQLLRDSMYRLCEGYMGGAMDQPQYQIMMRRYQKDMVALLAIEQLTGAVHPPQVTITTEGRAAAGQSMAALQKQIDDVDANVSDLKQQQTDADADTKKSLQAQIDKLTKQKQSLQSGLQNAQGVLVNGAAQVTTTSFGNSKDVSDTQIEKVASVVQAIAQSIVNADDTGQLCFAYLAGNISTTARLATICYDALNLANQKAQLQLKIFNQQVDGISKNENLSSEEKLKRLNDLGAKINDIDLGAKLLSEPIKIQLDMPN